MVYDIRDYIPEWQYKTIPQEGMTYHRIRGGIIPNVIANILWPDVLSGYEDNAIVKLWLKIGCFLCDW